MVETITKEELLDKMSRKENFILLDVRDTLEFKKEHIVGAKHLLIAEMNKGKLEGSLSKEDLIVTYSEDINCPAKNIAAQKLIDFGYKNVHAYQGSWKEWKEAGYPVEISGQLNNRGER
jgi:rhodanese-related sulfurtransferase